MPRKDRRGPNCLIDALDQPAPGPASGVQYDGPRTCRASCPANESSTEQIKIPSHHMSSCPRPGFSLAQSRQARKKLLASLIPVASPLR